MSSKNVKRVQVVLTEEQYEILQELKGELGASDSEVVRNIVLSWLMEKSFITTKVKARMGGSSQ